MSGTRTSSPTTSSTHIFLLWLWVSLGAGVATAIGLGLARFVLHRFVHESPDLVWTAPVAFGVFLAPFGLIAWLARKALRGRANQVALFCFATIAGYGVLLNLHGVHPVALWLIAIGIGVQLSRLLTSRTELMLRIVRRTVPLLVGLVLVGTVGLFAQRWWRERQALSALPAADKSRPNVLLLVLDTVRSFSLSVYGFPRPTTPALERLAASGAVFETAFSTAPWTLPSHASIMTGTWAWENEASWTNPLDRRFPTLAEELAKLGYVNGGFIANTQYTSAESGLERGFSHYSDWVVSFPMILRSTLLGRRMLDHSRTLTWFGRYSYFDRRMSPSVSESISRWRQAHRDRPYFAFLNLYDAHAPYDPPAPFDSLFGAREPRRKADLTMDRNWPADEVARHERAYEASIAAQDHEIGLLLAELERDGSLDNTIVIVTADHGEEFYEHDVMGHGHSVYPATIQVPLLIRYPAKIQPRRIGVPTSNRTIASTVWELVGQTAPSPFPGRSLGGLLRGDPGADSAATGPILVQVDFAPNLLIEYPVSHGPLHTVIDGGFQYITNKEGKRELYRFKSDPSRGPNLVDDPALRSTVDRLAFLLDSMTKAP